MVVSNLVNRGTVLLNYRLGDTRAQPAGAVHVRALAAAPLVGRGPNERVAPNGERRERAPSDVAVDPAKGLRRAAVPSSAGAPGARTDPRGGGARRRTRTRPGRDRGRLPRSSWTSSRWRSRSPTSFRAPRAARSARPSREPIPRPAGRVERHARLARPPRGALPLPLAGGDRARPAPPPARHRGPRLRARPLLPRDDAPARPHPGRHRPRRAHRPPAPDRARPAPARPRVLRVAGVAARTPTCGCGAGGARAADHRSVGPARAVRGRRPPRAIRARSCCDSSGRRLRYREARIVVPPRRQPASTSSAFASLSLLPQALRADRMTLSLLDPPEVNLPRLNEFRPDVISRLRLLPRGALHPPPRDRRSAFTARRSLFYGGDPLSDAHAGADHRARDRGSERLQLDRGLQHRLRVRAPRRLPPERRISSRFASSTPEGAMPRPGRAARWWSPTSSTSGTVLLNYRLGDVAANVGGALRMRAHPAHAVVHRGTQRRMDRKHLGAAAPPPDRAGAALGRAGSVAIPGGPDRARAPQGRGRGRPDADREGMRTRLDARARRSSRRMGRTSTSRSWARSPRAREGRSAPYVARDPPPPGAQAATIRRRWAAPRYPPEGA